MDMEADNRKYLEGEQVSYCYVRKANLARLSSDAIVDDRHTV